MLQYIWQNQSGCNYSFFATIAFIAPDKILINSRRTGSIIWIIRIIWKPHHTFYKQKTLSCGFRQRVRIISEARKSLILLFFEGLRPFGAPAWRAFSFFEWQSANEGRLRSRFLFAVFCVMGLALCARPGCGKCSMLFRFGGPPIRNEGKKTGRPQPVWLRAPFFQSVPGGGVVHLLGCILYLRINSSLLKMLWY